MALHGLAVVAGIVLLQFAGLQSAHAVTYANKQCSFFQAPGVTDTLAQGAQSNNVNVTSFELKPGETITFTVSNVIGTPSWTLNGVNQGTAINGDSESFTNNTAAPINANYLVNLINNADTDKFDINITCTTATRVNLQIIKALPQGGTGTFTFNLTQGSNTGSISTASAGTVGTFSVIAGVPFTVQEVITNSTDTFTTTSSCTAFDPSNRTLSATITAATSCTFTNTKQQTGTPGLTIVKTSPTPSYSNVGDVITYSLVVTNTGTVTLTNVSINDPGAVVGPCSSIVLPGTLNPGQSTTCSATHTVVQADIGAGSYTNTATASGTTPSQGTVVSDPSSVTTPFVGRAPTISLTKVPNPTTYADAGETITYVYTVTNTGPVEVTSLTLVDDVIGAITCPSTTLAIGASVVCQATYVTTLNDVANKCIKNTATATALANATTATATADAEVCLSNKKTRKIIRDFINRRVDLLASNEPDRARLMRRFHGTESNGDGQAVAFSGSSENGTTRMAFATSLSQIRAANATKTQKEARELAEEQKKKGTGPFEGRMALGAGAAALGASTKDEPVVVPRSSFDIWFEAHYQKWSDDDDPRDGDFAIMYVGADYLVSPNFLVGVLVQFDHMSDANAALNSDVRGNGWMAGPYLSAKFGEHLYFDARGAWGTSTNDISPFGTYTDKFETTRWLAKANLTGKWMLGKMRFSPSVGVIYVEETQKAYTDLLGLLIPEQTARVGRLQFGPEFGYPIQMDNGAVIEPHISATAMWDFGKTDGLSITGLPIAQDDFRMKVEGGLIARSPDGYSMRATISYDGIGSDDFEAWGGSLWVNIPLN